MASPKTIIQPVWGLSKRNLSSAMLDTAENLVENLDDISDVLDKLTEKYEKETASVASFEIEKDDEETESDNTGNGNTNEEEATNNEEVEKVIQTNPNDSSDSQAHARLFLKLKSGLDAARKLIDCLRYEKRRVMKRELSVECRIGEIEDYKEHMKHDLASMNEMIDLLSFRIRQLEDQLVDQQEQIETLEAEKIKFEDKLEVYENTVADLKSDNDLLLEQTQSLRRERTNTSMMLENKELLFKIEMLVVENSKLKEMVRRYNEDEVQSVSSEGDLGQSRDTKVDNRNNNIHYSGQYSTTSGEDSDS